MAKKASGASEHANELVAKIYKLKERALRILEQAEQLAGETAADKSIIAQAKKIAAEAKLMADEARPAKKMES
jgi:uncharacterized coiled-coil DUF342 family protein